MRTFTIPEIRAHFIGVSCAQYSQIFIALLVRNKILVKISEGRYTYNLNNLSSQIIVEISKECKNKQFGYHGTYRTNPKVQNKKD